MATLIYQGELRRLTGKHDETADVASMNEVMRYLSKTYGKEVLQHARRCLVALDGIKVENLYKREKTVSAGSEVYFFPLGCGG